MKDIGQEIEISLDLWILFHLFQNKGNERKMKAILYSLEYQSKSGKEAEKIKDRWYAGYPNKKYEKILSNKFKPVFNKKRDISFLNKNINFSIEIEEKKETKHLEKIFSDTALFVSDFNFLDKLFEKVITDNISLLDEKTKFTIKFTKSTEKPDIHVLLNETKFLGIEIVEIHTPKYNFERKKGSVMKEIYKQIENEQWEKIKKNKSGLVNFEKVEKEAWSIFGIRIRKSTPEELMKETEKEITRKLQKKYFQNPEFKIMTIWTFLLPQFFLTPWSLLLYERELKTKLTQSDFLEKMSGMLNRLKEKNLNFLLVNYLETYPPRLDPVSEEMDKSHYFFNNNFLIPNNNFENKLLLEKIKEELKEENPSYSQAKLKTDHFSLLYYYKKSENN
ncbi:hypothetical protein [endosymbiont GvMRE of Glomus versiforme]|uniref:hypothetical protein n=1 Tax=endosymbiont GvMRE of Glomus versiforme TaxID=2039283 RepID=UPI000EE6162C|nr:hypothetical protein [endosymbiont GvMRE of Glomus versiforme]RHZ35909.1 hypothetical protein GvMRE_Ic4g78 [endosymbiont GvMRE of Glomus versiforme]